MNQEEDFIKRQQEHFEKQIKALENDRYDLQKALAHKQKRRAIRLQDELHKLQASANYSGCSTDPAIQQLESNLRQVEDQLRQRKSLFADFKEPAHSSFLSDFHPEYKSLLQKHVNLEPLNVVVIGSTGVGKSSMLSMLVDPVKRDTFKSAYQLAPVTTLPSSFQYLHETCFGLKNNTVKQYDINLVDTPGLNDTTSEPGADLKHINRFLEQIKSLKKIHSLLFVAKLGRFDNQFKKTLQYCCSDLFTSVPDNFIKIVFTHLDEETFLDSKEDPEDSPTMVDVYRQEISSLLGQNSPAFRLYFVHSGRTKDMSDHCKTYVNYFRDHTDLNPSTASKDEWSVETLAFHSLYFRDRLIYDIGKDSTYFNWDKTNVKLPPTIEPLRINALLKLYQQKQKLFDGKNENEIGDQTIKLMEKEGHIKDEISKLEDESKCVLKISEKFSRSKGSRVKSIEIPSDVNFEDLKWHDNSTGITVDNLIHGCPPSGGKTISVFFRVIGWSGTLTLDFYHPGSVINRKEIEKKKAELSYIEQSLCRLKNKTSDQTSQIDSQISKLNKSRFKMDELERVYELITSDSKAPAPAAPVAPAAPAPVAPAAPVFAPAAPAAPTATRSSPSRFPVPNPTYLKRG